ncbi:hypothetical protein A3Q56_02438 [Intoshia linei]|uniref:Partial AB-hydrolase lipase domain-containing protein n=1 Tax=Intoshia linei TaxID=1819745 RepID=A0A177B7Z8_9BILA|nr:hypothetical protein A3Q56_02438 [Intoshia linei]
MKSTLTYFIIFLFINAMNSIGFKSLKHASLIDMVNQTKFIAVKHNVTTEDGYIIEIHQISKLDNKKNKRVIFVQHGLLCSSDIWLDNGPNSALAYVMAENGYNVFLGNVRGNTYGRHHINISTGDSEFWNFT